MAGFVPKGIRLLAAFIIPMKATSGQEKPHPHVIRAITCKRKAPVVARKQGKGHRA
jgi:hypothetical protein